MQTFQYVLIALAVIVIIVILMNMGSEFLTPIYLDQIATNFVDPTVFAFLGDERDLAGMSSRDYYLDNAMQYANGAAPGYFKNSQLYRNQVDYLDIPVKFRSLAPASQTLPMRMADQLAQQAEVAAGTSVVQTGQY